MLYTHKVEKNMSQITLQFENDSIKRHFLKIIELMNGVSVVKPQKDVTKTDGYKEAMKDIQEGRVYHADSVDDMFHSILGYVPN